VPGAEVLGGEVALGDLSQVVVDVGGGYVAPGPAHAVREQFVTAATASFQAAYDGADLFVGDGLLALLRAFRRIFEDQLSSGARHVVSANRCKTVRTVLCRVLLAFGPEETEIDQADRRREHLVPAESGTGQMTLDHLAYVRQRGPEPEYPIMLVTISPLPPQIVVPILPPPCGIRPHGLDVAGGIRTDPDVLPCRRDYERLDPGQRFRVGHRGGLIQVTEPRPHRLRRIPERLGSLRTSPSTFTASIPLHYPSIRVYAVEAPGSGGAGSGAAERAASLSASAPCGGLSCGSPPAVAGGCMDFSVEYTITDEGIVGW
jgi:hypothetical protein